MIGGGGADIYYGDFEPQQEYSFWYDTNRLELFVSYEGMWFPASPGVGGGGGGGITEEELAPLLEPYARLDGADFTAKVTVQPGTKDNEVVTFQQLQEIEEEIEDIRPTLERGVWSFEMTGPSQGKYSLIRENSAEYCNAIYLECIAEAPDDPANASRCLRERDECAGNPDNPPRVYIDEWVQLRSNYK